MAVSAVLDAPSWQPVGPVMTGGGQVIGIPNSTTAGAVNAIAVVRDAMGNPTGVVYLGTANGGVWKTDNINRVDGSGNPSPVWTPLTDNFSSLAITTLTLDPGDPTGQTLYAGTGNTSSAHQGGQAIGVLKTTDGGDTWTLVGGGVNSIAGHVVSSIVIEPNPTVANPSAERIFVGTEGGGLYTSDDAGTTWTAINGAGAGRLPSGDVTDLVDVVQNNQHHLFAGLIGVSMPGPTFTLAPDTGIYEADPTALTWTKVSSNLTDASGQPFSLLNPNHFVSKIHLTTDGAGTLYAGVVEATQPGGDAGFTEETNIFRTSDLGTSWTDNTTAVGSTEPVASGSSPASSISQIVLTFGGEGYTTAPTVTISGGGGTGAVATATLGGGGSISAINVTNGGANYTVPPTIQIQGGPGTGAKAIAILDPQTNTIDEILITNPGSGYTAPVTVNIQSAGGATATATIGFQQITTIYVTKGGSGYTSAPTVTISGGGGTNATATANIQNGAVVSVTITNPGSGYTSDPTVKFTGGGGSGATATAYISGVTSVTVTGAGAGYTANPTITFTGASTLSAEATAVRSAFYGLEPGGQGDLHFAFTPVPGSPNNLFLAGDSQPTVNRSVNVVNGSVPLNNSVNVDNYVGRVFQLNTATANPNDHGTQLIGSGANNTAPHADSRVLAIIGTTLLMGGDGGIYELTNFANAGTRRWQSLNGNLDIGEVYSIAYDPLSGKVVAGQQDNGVTEGTSASTAWTQVQGGDGNTEGVVKINGSSDYVFSMSNNFNTLIRRKVTSTGGTVTTGPTERVLLAAQGSTTRLSGLSQDDRNFSGFTVIPYALNAYDVGRMVIGLNNVYEASNYGDTILRQITYASTMAAPNAPVSAIAYGASDNPRALYVGRGNTVAVRLSAGSSVFANFQVLPGADVIRDIVIDPTSSKVAYAISSSKVFVTIDSGQSWTDITGQFAGAGNVDLQTVQIIHTPASAMNPATDELLVGGLKGVFRTLNPVGAPGTANYRKAAAVAPVYSEFGLNLPDAEVTDILYASDGKLFASTLGRGVFMLPASRTSPGSGQARSLADDLANPNLPVLVITGDSADNAIVIGQKPANPTQLFVLADGDKLGEYTGADISKITVAGNAGNDTLTINANLRNLMLPQGVVFDGGTGTNTLILKRLDATDPNPTTTSAGASGGTVTFPNLTVAFSNAFTVFNGFLPQASDQDNVNQIADGLNNVRNQSGSLVNKLNSLGKRFGFSNLFGKSTTQPNPLGDLVGAPASDGEADSSLPDRFGSAGGTSLLDTILSGGPNGFSLDQIGTVITSMAGLRDALDALDSTPNNVILTSQGGAQILDITVAKTIETGTTLDLNALGGAFHLGGTLDLSLDVTFHLRIGVDAAGFFIDTSGNPGPVLRFSNFQIAGGLDATGTLGFASFGVKGATIQLDPGVGLELDLNTPAGASTRVDPLTLGPEFLNRLGVQVTGGSGHDMTVSANLFVSLGSFQAAVPLAITLPDLSSPTVSPNLSGLDGAFDQFKAFLVTAKNTLADGLDQVAFLGSSIDNAPGFNQPIDLIHGSLGSYLNLGGTLSSRLTTPLSNYLRNTDFPTINGVLDALRQANDIPAEGVQMTFGPGITLDVDGSGLRLGYAFDYQRSVSIALDLGLGGPSLPISLDASANVVLTADATFGLTLGIDFGKLLSDPGDAFYLASDPNPTIAVQVAAPGGIQITGRLDPLTATLDVQGTQASLIPGSTDTTLISAAASLQLNPSGGGQITINDLLNKPFNQLVVLNLDAGLGLNIPISLSLGGTPVPIPGTPAITISAPQLLHVDSLGNVSFQTPAVTTPSLSQFISLASLMTVIRNPAVLADGLDQVLQFVQGGLNDASALGQTLPLVGDKLEQGAQIIDQFRSGMLTTIRNDLQNAGDRFIASIQQDLFNLLGPDSPANLLVPLDGLPDNPSDPNRVNRFVQVVYTPDGKGIQFNLHLHQNAVDTAVTPALDLGLPGLALSLNGQVKLNIGWDFRLGFGVSLDKGLYLVADTRDANNQPVDAIGVDVKVTTPGLTASGTLGVLQATATDGVNGQTTLFAGHFGIDLLDPKAGTPAADGRLDLTDLFKKPAIRSVLLAKFDAQANVNFHLDAKMAPIDFLNQPTSFLPEVTSDFHLGWNFKFDTSTRQQVNAPPTVQFSNVQLNVGSFFSDFFRPILSKIQEVLSPFNTDFPNTNLTLLDILTKPIPGLSDLSVQAGGPQITMVSLIDNLITAEEGPQFAHVADFVNALKYLVNLNVPTDGNFVLNLGSFSLADARQIATPIQTGANVPSSTQVMQTLQNSGGNQSQSVFKASGSITGFKLDFPILSNPLNIFKLITQHTFDLSTVTDLIDVEIPQLSAGLTFSQTIPIADTPLGVLIGGGINLSAHLTFGYDTTGIAEYQNDHNLADLLDGLWIGTHQNPLNTANPGPIVPQFGIRGILTLGLVLGEDLAGLQVDAGISGSIELPVYFSLKDPNNDGKVRTNELAQELSASGGNPFSLFNIYGDIEGAVNVFAHAVVVNVNYEIARGVLFSFSTPGSSPPAGYTNVPPPMVPPSATFKAPATIAEGALDPATGNVDLAFAPVFTNLNPGTGDLANLAYEVGFDDGSGHVIWGPPTPAAYTPVTVHLLANSHYLDAPNAQHPDNVGFGDGPRTIKVYGRVVDLTTGLSQESVSTVQVQNVAPTAVFKNDRPFNADVNAPIQVGFTNGGPLALPLSGLTDTAARLDANGTDQAYTLSYSNTYVDQNQQNYNPVLADSLTPDNGAFYGFGSVLVGDASKAPVPFLPANARAGWDSGQINGSYNGQNSEPFLLGDINGAPVLSGVFHFDTKLDLTGLNPANLSLSGRLLVALNDNLEHVDSTGQNLPGYRRLNPYLMLAKVYINGVNVVNLQPYDLGANAPGPGYSVYADPHASQFEGPYIQTAVVGNDNIFSNPAALAALTSGVNDIRIDFSYAPAINGLPYFGRRMWSPKMLHIYAEFNGVQGAADKGMDPSPADTQAGFTYSYDFGNTGTFQIVDSPSNVVTVPDSALAPLRAGQVDSLTVRGRIKDKDGGYTDYLTVITASAVPSVAAGGPYTIAGGQSLVLQANQDVPSGFTLLPSLTTWTINGQTVPGNGLSLTESFAQLQAIGIGNQAASYTATVTLAYTAPGGGTVYHTSEPAAINVTLTPPTLTMTGAATASEGQPYTLTLNAAQPGGAQIAGWLINWGDNQLQTVLDATGTVAVPHTYPLGPGHYTITAQAILPTQEAQVSGSFSGQDVNVQTTVNPTSLALQSVPAAGPDPTINLAIPANLTAVGANVQWAINFGDGTTGSVYVERTLSSYRVITETPVIDPTTGAFRVWPSGQPYPKTVASFVPLGTPSIAVTHHYINGVQPFSIDATYAAGARTLGVPASQTVTVTNLALPAVTLAGPSQVDEGTSVTFTSNVQDRPEIVARGFGYLWTITAPDGSLVDTPTTSFASFNPTQLGTYGLRLDVTDEFGQTTTTIGSLLVGNVPPSLTVAGNQEIKAGSTLVLPVLGQFSDPALAGTSGGASETYTYHIDWGDTTPADSGQATVTQLGSIASGANGPVSLPTLGSFGGQHTYASAGQYTVNVTLDDGGSGSPVTKSFVVVVDPPLGQVSGTQALVITVNPGDHIEIAHAGGAAGDETLVVTTNGQAQTFSDVSSIKTVGTSGPSWVTVDAGVLDDAELDGGTGSDQLSAFGSGTVVLHGGGGSDMLTAGGTGPSTLFADSGDDRLVVDPSTVSVDGGTGNSTVVALADADFTLADGTLRIGPSTTIALANVHLAELTEGPSGHTLDVGGWTGQATLISGSPSDVVTATGNTDFTLSDTLLTLAGGGRFNLQGIRRALLTGGTGDNTFDLSGWTGSASLEGVVGSDRLVLAADANFTLVDGRLDVSDGASIALSHVARADLTGGASGSTFDVGGWTGTGSLNGGGGNAVVAASADTDFTLTDTALALGTGARFTLAAVGQARLTGGPSGNTFQVSGWSGVATLDGGLGADTYNVALDGTGTVNLADSGNDGAADLAQLLLAAPGGPVVITPSAVTFLGQTVNFTPGLSELDVNGDGNDHTFQVAGTIAGTTRLRAGGGNDTVDVQSIGGPTFVVGGTGTLAVHVGSQAPAPAGTLAGIADVLSVQGGSGAASLSLDDTGNAAPATGRLTATQLTGLDLPTTGAIVYGGLSSLDVSLGSGGVAFTIAGTNAATATTVNAGSGGDTINVQAVAGLTAVNAGGGNDAVNVGSLAPASGGTLAGIQGALSLDGGPGLDTLTLDDGGDLSPTQGVLTAGSLANLFATIAYRNFESLVLNLGQGDDTLTIKSIDPNLITRINGNGGNDTFNAAFADDFNGSLTLDGGPGTDTFTGAFGANFRGSLALLNIENIPTVHVQGDLSGSLSASGPGNVQHMDIGGSLTPTGLVAVDRLDSLTVGPNGFSPGHDLAGRLTVTGPLGQVRVAGGTPGLITAGSVGSVGTFGGYGPVVLQIVENGVMRRVEAALPGDPFPNPALPPAATTAASPAGVTFQYLYESAGLSSPQLTARVTNASGKTGPDQFDLSLVTWNDVARFNLARLDAVGISGIRNVAVEGDLLTTVTTAARSFLGLAANAPGGVRLPSDRLAGVAVRDFASPGSIQASSIQAVAFGSTADPHCGGWHFGDDHNHEGGPSSLLVQGTALAQANDTFRVPFADLASQQVSVYLVLDPAARSFSDSPIDLTVQSINGQPTNVARGAVTALITAAPTYDRRGRPQESVVSTIALRGDGGSIETDLYVSQGITSTGPLGDLTFGSWQGMTNVTAPAIFGNINASGPITGTIQTTGQRLDPITGAVANLLIDPITGVQTPVGSAPGSADIGRLYLADGDGHGRSDCNDHDDDDRDRDHAALTATTIQAQGGINGQILSRGNLISQISTQGGFDGLIAVGGNLGMVAPDGTPAARMTRYGGLESDGAFTGQLVTAGSILGDLTIHGGLRGGRIAAQGGMIGNVTVDGGLDSTAALVSGGVIGSPAWGTTLDINGNTRGLIAARGAIQFDRGQVPHSGSIFNNVGTTGPNALAIDALFTQLDTDLSTGDLVDIPADLAALQVVKGVLTWKKP